MGSVPEGLMRRLHPIVALLLAVVGAVVAPRAEAFEVVTCGWYCSAGSFGNQVDCVGEGAFLRHGSMSSCEVRAQCMPDAFSNEQCTYYCVGPQCYWV